VWGTPLKPPAPPIPLAPGVDRCAAHLALGVSSLAPLPGSVADALGPLWPADGPTAPAGALSPLWPDLDFADHGRSASLSSSDSRRSCGTSGGPSALGALCNVDAGGGPLPIGLKLKKSPSFLDLLNERLSARGGRSGGGGGLQLPPEAGGLRPACGTR
jgi:hypothetical protein